MKDEKFEHHFKHMIYIFWMPKKLYSQVVRSYKCWPMESVSDVQI